MGEKIMLKLISSGNAVIEDMENDIIYVLGESQNLRVIKGYETTYTSAQNMPMETMMPIMRCMLERLQISGIGKDNPEIPAILADGLNIIEKLNIMPASKGSEKRFWIDDNIRLLNEIIGVIFTAKVNKPIKYIANKSADIYIAL